MNRLAIPPTIFQRSGLLSLVIGLHVGIFVLLLASRTVAPKVIEMPMMVDFLAPPKALETARPQAAPPSKAQTPRPLAPQPAAQTPRIESSSSSVPSSFSAAPVAQPESRPATPAPAPVAEPLSQARFDADTLNNPAPPYPPLARRMGEEGKVILRVSVTPQGTAETVETRLSSGSYRLDEAAQKTVRTWKFIPARRGDTPVQSWVLVPIIFKLEQ